MTQNCTENNRYFDYFRPFLLGGFSEKNRGESGGKIRGDSLPPAKPGDSRPKTRQTEVKKLRKENKEQGKQLEEKDAEIRKLREKLEAAEINMSSVNKD